MGGQNGAVGGQATVPTAQLYITELALLSSVADLKTSNLDTDPEFWPNLDPGPGLCCQS